MGVHTDLVGRDEETRAENDGGEEGVAAIVWGGGKEGGREGAGENSFKLRFGIKDD